MVDGVFIGTNTGQLLDSFDMERLELSRDGAPQRLTEAEAQLLKTLALHAHAPVERMSLSPDTADITGRATDTLNHFNLTLHACTADGVITPEEQTILDEQLSTATSLTQTATTRAQTIAAD